METSNTVNTAIFSAFLKCPMKARFLAIAEPPPETYFSELEAGISSAYKSRAILMLRDRGEAAKPATFLQTKDTEDLGAAPRWVNCDTAVYDLSLLQHGSVDRCARKSSAGELVVPVLFSPWDKAELSDCLLVCFGALSLSQSTGMPVETGTLVYGDNFRRKTVRISDYAARITRTLRAIGDLLSDGQEPPLILNRHCPVCDFRSRCRGLAIERDDLSLLSGMTPKDRTKALAKGILTISQLSYGYRPRRRKRTKPDAERSAKSVDASRARPPVRHDNKLKALAIKKGLIHVVGAPALEFDGVSTFIDVEGMPDKDFFYLVGLRFETEGRSVEHAFWADGPEDERGMWENCLQTLKSIGNAQLAWISTAQY